MAARIRRRALAQNRASFHHQQSRNRPRAITRWRSIVIVKTPAPPVSPDPDTLQTLRLPRFRQTRPAS